MSGMHRILTPESHERYEAWLSQYHGQDIYDENTFDPSDAWVLVVKILNDKEEVVDAEWFNGTVHVSDW